jgi:dihydrolipoamide dehydrogenase
MKLTVPDIGDFDSVEVIEVLIQEGDAVKKEQSLITVESDKASMEIPASDDGVVVKLLVKVGDKVKQGTEICEVKAADGAAAQKPAGQSAPATIQAEPSKADAPQAEASKADSSKGNTAKPVHSSAYSGKVDHTCDMLVLGAGPGGYSAAFRSADLGMNTILVERYPTLGGVCLNVGCIPSKALLHTAQVLEEAQHMGEHGIAFAAPKIDLDKLRAHKEGVVGKLTSGLAGMAKGRKVRTVQGVGSFLSPNHVEVIDADGGKQVIEFSKAIVAVGSQPVHLPFIPEDPRIVDSTGALELPFIPKRMLIIGGGIIGLEMATVYSALGARLEVVEMLDGLMQGADRDLVKVWQKRNAPRFDKIMMKTKTVAVEAKKKGIEVTFEGEQAPDKPQLYDMVLVSVGRTPNGKKIAAEKAGVQVTDRGFIPVDKQMRTNVPNIFAIGDVVGQPMLAHKAVHEAHVAAEAAADEKAFFDARVIPSVAYTHPEVAWVGLTEDQAKDQGIKVGKAVFPWAASGRAIANNADDGFTKLLFDEETKRVVGGGIVGMNAGDLIGEVCLAVEMGADAVDIGKTIHPHPTLCESVGMAAEVYKGVCTDLPAQKKK